jgi:hypothetical protein
MKNALILTILLLFGIQAKGLAQPGIGWGDGLPGVQQIIAQYGDQLNLTDSQKSELAALHIDRRMDLQRQRMRSDRQNHSVRSGRHDMRGDRQRLRNSMNQSGDEAQNEMEEKDEEDLDTGKSVRTRSASFTRSDLYQQIHEILTDEQSAELRSILTERANSQHEFRVLRFEEMISRAGMEGDKADQVKEIFVNQSRIRTNLIIDQIQNPGEMERENMQEAFRNMREGHRELMNILTAAEYEKLYQEISPRSHRQQPLFRRSVYRSR